MTKMYYMFLTVNIGNKYINFVSLLDLFPVKGDVLAFSPLNSTQNCFEKHSAMSSIQFNPCMVGKKSTRSLAQSKQLAKWEPIWHPYPETSFQVVTNLCKLKNNSYTVRFIQMVPRTALIPRLSLIVSIFCSSLSNCEWWTSSLKYWQFWSASAMGLFKLTLWSYTILPLLPSIVLTKRFWFLVMTLLSSFC